MNKEQVTTMVIGMLLAGAVVYLALCNTQTIIEGWATSIVPVIVILGYFVNMAQDMR